MQLALRSSCDRDLRETWSQHPARRGKALGVWLTILDDLLEIGCNLFIRTVANHGGQLNGTMQSTEERLQVGVDRDCLAAQRANEQNAMRGCQKQAIKRCLEA